MGPAERFLRRHGDRRILLRSRCRRCRRLGRGGHGGLRSVTSYRHERGAAPKHLSSKELLFERWKAKRDVVGVWKADGEFKKNFPRWSWFWNNVLRRIIVLNEKRMIKMYGEKGRFRRQMNQWARLNDFFGDMVIDESFFDPDAEGVEALGSADTVEYGVPPHTDTSEEPAFVSTRELQWSQRVAATASTGSSSEQLPVESG